MGYNKKSVYPILGGTPVAPPTPWIRHCWNWLLWIGYIDIYIIIFECHGSHNLYGILKPILGHNCLLENSFLSFQDKIRKEKKRKKKQKEYCSRFIQQKRIGQKTIDSIVVFYSFAWFYKSEEYTHS